MSDSTCFARTLGDVRALPLRAVPPTPQRAAQVAVAKMRSQALPSEAIAAQEACDLFLRNNALNKRAFRLIESEFAAVERRSIDAPRVGHPFMDALLAAHEHGTAFTFGPNDIWDLVWRAMSVYLHQYETTANRLARAVSEFTHSPDGTTRICFSTHGDLGYLDGALDDAVWFAVCKQFLEKVGEMCDAMTQLAVPQCDEKCGKRGTRCASDGANHVKHTLKLDKKSTKMPPVNLIAEQRALPLPATPAEQNRAADEKNMPGIERLMLQGTLRSWTNLLHAIDAIAEFPTFVEWGARVLWLVYHFVLHYQRFTPDKSKRPPIAASVHAKLRALQKAMPLAHDLSHFAADFFGVQSDTTSNRSLHLCGSALLLFPHEAGYLQISPPCVAPCAVECVDFDWNVCGIDIAAFNNVVSTIDAAIYTPDCEVSMLYVQGAFGWVYHQSKRAIEVARMATVVFGEHEHNSAVLPRANEQEEQFVATNVDEIARDALVLRRERADAVNDMMQLLDKCNGQVDVLVAYSETAQDQLQNLSLRDWPALMKSKESIGAWRAEQQQEEQSVVVPDESSELSSELVGEAPSTSSDDDEDDIVAASSAFSSGCEEESDRSAGDDESGDGDASDHKQETASSDGSVSKDDDSADASALDDCHAKQRKEQIRDMREEMRVMQEKMQQMQTQMREQTQQMYEQMREQTQQMQKHMREQKEQMQHMKKQASEQRQRDRKSQAERDSRLAGKIERVCDGMVACEAEIVRIKAALSDAPALLLPADQSAPTSDKEQDDDEEDGDWQTVGATPTKDKKNQTLQGKKDGAAQAIDSVALAPPPQVHSMHGNGAPVHWALPVRIVATGGIDGAQATAYFAATALHMSARRVCTTQHFCARHRNSGLAPPSLDDFYDRVTQKDAQMSLFALLAAVADQEMQCVRCASSADLADQTRLLHGGIGECAEEAPQPLPQFVRSLYNMLASVDYGGSAFRACAVCKREFRNDRYRIALLVLGVTSAGTVRVRIALRCDDHSAQQRCASLLLQHFEGPERSAPGLALSVSRVSEWSDDMLVRVHASGTCAERDPHDLLLHLAGDAKARPFVYQEHQSLARRWSAHRNH